MTIKYTFSIVTAEVAVVKQLQLENDPILMMQYIKNVLNKHLRQSKLKTLDDLRVVDVRSLYKPTEEKYYFYVTTRYTYEERE